MVFLSWYIQDSAEPSSPARGSPWHLGIQVHAPSPGWTPPMCTWILPTTPIRLSKVCAAQAPYSHHARPPAGIWSPVVIFHQTQGQRVTDVVPATDAVFHVGTVGAWGRRVFRGVTGWSPLALIWLSFSILMWKVGVQRILGPQRPHSWLSKKPLSTQSLQSASASSREKESDCLSISSALRGLSWWSRGEDSVLPL